MNRKKPHKEKAIGAGISLPRDLIERAKQYAETKGFSTLSGLIKWLLTQHLAGNPRPVLPSLSPMSSALERSSAGHYPIPMRLKTTHLIFRATPALKKDVENVAKSQGLKSGEWMHAVIEKAIKDGVMVRQQVSYEVFEATARPPRKSARTRKRK
jgi:hypothetical protein